MMESVRVTFRSATQVTALRITLLLSRMSFHEKPKFPSTTTLGKMFRWTVTTHMNHSEQYVTQIAPFFGTSAHIF